MLKWVLKIKNDLELKGLVWFCTFAGFVWFRINLVISQELPRKCSGKESTCQRRRHKRHRFDTWVGRSPEGGNGNPLQYSCLGNPMDRGVCHATVHGITKSQAYLSTHTFHHQAVNQNLWTSRDFTFQRPRREKAALNSCPWKPYPGPHCQGWPSMFW